MSLAVGTKLGPYEILAPLGAGGMGEVYRARDSRVDRMVALKVVRADFLVGDGSRDRRERFEREARALAALTHPSIATLYSFEELPDSSSSNPRHILTMEFLEGGTLRSELAGGRLPPRKAIDYAVQIAEGLAAAHAKGIVHRDLKPENVFVTRDGRVKVLDFGLAKLKAADDSSSISSLPTETQRGVVMGTPGYLSPEQIKGEAVDARSDIFALGVVLYELLSGERPFRGASTAETMAAILKEDPPDLGVMTPSVGPGLERLVRHCLEKDPERRFQSARDLAYDLAALSVDSGAAPRIAVPREAGARTRRVLAGAALAAVALAAGWGLGTLRTKRSDPAFTRLTFRKGTVYEARFAPDGRTVVYSAAWEGQPARIYATHVGSVESRSLPLPDARVLSISSTGELAILVGRQTVWTPVGTLARVPLEGGAPREILENVLLADWTPDGRDLAVVRDVAGTNRLEFPVGKVLYETSGLIASVRFSPKGDRLAIAADGGVLAVDLSGKVTRLAQRPAGNLAWRSDGSEVWFGSAREGQKFAVHAVDLAGRVRVVRSETGGIYLHDVSKEGRVLLNEYFWYSGLMGLFPGANTERELSWMDQPLLDGITADGTRVVFDEWGDAAGRNGAIYVRATDGSAAVRLAEGEGLAVSSDGRWVLSRPSRSSEDFMLLPTGPGQARRLPHRGIKLTPGVLASFFPDGKRVLYLGSKGNAPPRFWAQDLEGGEPRPVSPEGMRAGPAAISPDGKSFAAARSGSTIAIYPADGGEPRPLAGAEAEDVPVLWSADGRSLYVRRENVAPADVVRIDLATGVRTLWKTLGPADRSGLVAVDNVVMTPDARSCAYSYQRILTSLQVLDGLR